MELITCNLGVLSVKSTTIDRPFSSVVDRPKQVTTITTEIPVNSQVTTVMTVFTIDIPAV